MKKKHKPLQRIAEWQPTPEQRLTRMNKRLIQLMDTYNEALDPLYKHEIKLEVFDVIRTIEKLEEKQS